MSEATPTGDPLISKHEEAEIDAQRARRAANLFDLRRMIGGLFLIYGVILVILGLGASDAEIDKAAGWNLNLWVGVAMLITAAIFLAWAFARPLGDEIVGDERPEGDRRSPGRTRRPGPTRPRSAGQRRRAGGPGATATDPGGGSAPGLQQRQHGAAEPAADHARAGGAGRLEPRDRGLDRGHARLVVVAQARVRGVQQPAGLRQVGGRAAPRPSRRRGRSRTARGARGGAAARAAAPRPRGRRRRGARRRAPRTRRGTPRGARCSRPRRGCARAPESSVTSRQSPSSSGTGRSSSVAKSIRSAAPARLCSEASWSSSPVSRADPVVLDARAELRQLDAVGLLGARDGQQRQAERGLERRRRGQAGALRDVAGEREPRARRRRRPPRAARPPCRARTRASRSARPGAAASNASDSPRSRASARISPPSSGSASTVTPRSIANGSARPPL